MKYYQVIDLIKESGMTFEEIAPVLGASNMTLRRWEKKPKNTLVPLSYQCSIREGVYQLLVDGKLQGSSSIVEDLLEKSPSKSFEAAINSIGVSELIESKGMQNQEQITMILAEIGQNKDHVQEVDKKESEILKFKSFGESWSKNISILMNVIKSKDIFALDKLVAYGALFYLIFPMDLIPDSIPVIGYMDDFAFIALAVAFYVKKFPSLAASKTPRSV